MTAPRTDGVSVDLKVGAREVAGVVAAAAVPVGAAGAAPIPARVGEGPSALPVVVAANPAAAFGDAVAPVT